MKRRAILKYTALATGAAIAAPLMTTLLSGCQTDAVAKLPDYKPGFFNDTEFTILKKMVDLILPKTDSPSATEVGVQNIIDTMVGKVYENEEKGAYQKAFRGLLTYLNKDEKDTTFKNVIKNLSLEKLQEINDTKDENLKAVKDSFLHLKQQTVAYYLSTEEIGKNYLNYLPVPGEYQSCIQLADVGGKAWAL